MSCRDSIQAVAQTCHVAALTWRLYMCSSCTASAVTLFQRSTAVAPCSSICYGTSYGTCCCSCCNTYCGTMLQGFLHSRHYSIGMPSRMSSTPSWRAPLRALPSQWEAPCLLWTPQVCPQQPCPFPEALWCPRQLHILRDSPCPL